MEASESLSGVDGPTYDSAPPGVVIVGDREDKVLGAAVEDVMFEADAAFHNGPAIVLTAVSAGRRTQVRMRSPDREAAVVDMV